MIWRAFITLLILSLIAFLVWLVFFSPYKDGFKFNVITGISKKIIYSIENPTPSDISGMRNDCHDRSGTFNECGSPCGPDEVCIQVCAYTCEF